MIGAHLCGTRLQRGSDREWRRGTPHVIGFALAGIDYSRLGGPG